MDAKTKQETLRLLTNGMYVITSRGQHRLAAATVTWVSQVSFKPPLVMAAVRRNSSILHSLSESGVVALHMVGRHQKDVAQKFFSTTKGEGGVLKGEPFAEGKTSAPILTNLPAHLECRVVDIREEYGDHAIVILEVVEAELRKPCQVLTVRESPWRYGG
jgi:flavin reductase (DIM6/NTAB) family NADH-FMN oxidoreductase RutF